MDRFYAPGEAPGDKHYSSFEEQILEQAVERMEYLKDTISIYEDELSALELYYDQDDFEEMQAILRGL